jgi:molybdopterin converting factor small subunit
MKNITVDVALYGSVARCVGKKHLAQMTVQLKEGTTLGELVERWGIEKDETGYIFVNAVLCDVQGMNASHDLLLQDGDHVGIFSRVHMWPYQYRDGARMTESLRQALRAKGAIHHSYRSLE